MASYKEIRAAVEAERASRGERARQREAERIAVPSFDYVADTVDGITDAAAALRRAHLRRAPRPTDLRDGTPPDQTASDRTVSDQIPPGPTA
jgi:hypothetical protein